MFLHRICWRRLGFVTIRDLERGSVFRSDYLSLIITSVHRPTSIDILLTTLVLTPKAWIQMAWMTQSSQGDLG
jgi:hypothetical protein